MTLKDYLLVRNAAEVLDDVILNADTTLTNNINADGATIANTDAGKSQWLLGFDGLRHIGLVNNTTQGNDHNAVTDEAMYNEARALLGKYGVRPSELAFITDIQTYILTVGITNSNVRTLDAAARALDDTTANAGDELVPDSPTSRPGLPGA